MLPEKVREYARSIGEFYLKKHDGNYSRACEAVEKLQITKLEVIYTVDSTHPEGARETVVITTARPGMLIGKKGTNIDELSQHLNAHIKIVEEEDHLLYYLMPPDLEDRWI